MTVRSTDVDSGNHCEKIAVSRFRVSFARKSRGRIFKFNVLTIFSTFSESLQSTSLANEDGRGGGTF